ncbi:MAG: PKD domain-containing protein [Chloroflexi bacterium]|nr:MAG: PKD domain-containing protein [Chloroflexota bacterium]
MKNSLRGSVSRGSFAAALAATLSLAIAVPAQATTDTLDQSQTLTMSSQRQITFLAQTFTAGMSGQLDRVSLAADTTTGFANIRVSIQTVSASGTPSGTTLGSPTAFSGSFVCCRQFHDFALNPTVSITSGTRYAIVVQTVGGVFTWYNSSTLDAYTGGRLYVSSTWLTGSQWGEDFAFRTWVAASTNSAPSVAADTAAVNVNEGTAPTNTGTFFDPDGETVTLSASSGAVTKTGAGTWSWTRAASDEAVPQTESITADDGQSEPFTGAATTAFAGDSAGLTYSWRVTKNGAAYASGSNTSFAFTPDDDGTYVVTFQATDDGGISGSDSMTIIGTNVPPTAHVSVGQSLVTVPLQSVTFGGSFTDPGALDTHRVTWNFGDASSSTSNLGPGGSANFVASHAYSAAGTYTVRLTVTDDDGGAGQATATVTVQTAQSALSTIAGAVNGLASLNAGQKNSLVAKLKAASASAARGDNRACNNQLNAFLNEFEADVKTSKVSALQANTITGAVYAVKGSLGSYNRFLEWWPLAE